MGKKKTIIDLYGRFDYGVPPSKIVDVFNKGLEVEGFSRLVPVSEIADPKNDYNLNLPRYIDSGDEADIHDLNAHLKGGIPKRDVGDGGS